MKPHRKLFPSLSYTNQSTQDCPYFCDQTCPYYCYPNPDFYNFLPPPPQPPPEHGISPFVIILVSVLASIFLLVSYYIISSKSCPFWPFHNGQPQGELDPMEDEENRVDHPIWFISTAGLQQSVINSITVCKYKKGEGLIEGTECSVCLSEFRQDETLRLLPKCSHAFHVHCIDTWLRSHTNCPLCRAHIVNANVPPLTAPNQNLEDPNTPANTQMENPQTNRELGNFETLQSRDLEEGERTMKEEVHQRDSEISCDVQTMRRSLSMNYLTVKMFGNGPIETGNPAVESKKEGDKMGSSSIAQHLHMSPVAMKRSFSCGGRFFSSRQNRNLNSVFPL